MARLNDAMITGAYVRDVDRPILDLQYGGQMGWSPNLAEWTSNAAHVSRPLICILLEVPRVFTVMPDAQKWISSLKALFELHAYAIDGFTATLKVDTDTHDVGGGGEKQHEFVNVTREASVPKFTFIEKYGRPIQTLLDYWIRYGIMDPETKYALAGTLGKDEIKDLLADWSTATAMFIQPDPLHKSVDKAWLTTNMAPTTTGNIEAKRDIKTGQEILTLDIEFTGLSQVGMGVNKLAQTLLDQISTTNADPFMRPAFLTGVSADVAAAQRGYEFGLEEVGRTAVTRMGS